MNPGYLGADIAHPSDPNVALVSCDAALAALASPIVNSALAPPEQAADGKKRGWRELKFRGRLVLLNPTDGLGLVDAGSVLRMGPR